MFAAAFELLLGADVVDVGAAALVELAAALEDADALEAEAEEADEDDDAEEADALEPVVEADADAEEEPVEAVADAVPVLVPVAPLMPKLGEKLMLLGLLSSMISMVYWKVFTLLAGMVKVAVSEEAGTLPAKEVSRGIKDSSRAKESTRNILASTIPLSGVMPLPDCCSLMVTVPLEGLAQVIVCGSPA